MPSSGILTAATYEDFKVGLQKSNCPKCPALCETRHNIVVDRGNPKKKIVLIGEAPGEKEDLLAKCFVGRSGQLLDRVMASVGFNTNEDMLILNVVKCRPPANRAPTPQEAENCFPYLKQQLEFVKPQVVVLLGATAAKYLLPPEGKGMKDRVGRFFDNSQYPGIKFLLLYHPAYILRDPRKTKDMVEHIKILKEFMGRNS